MSPFESAGPFAPGDAFERLGVMETLFYGVVWEGKRFRASQAEPLTLLEMDHALLEEKESAERLLEALAAASKLSDPAVVTSHGAGREGNGVYLVWEALSGMSLARALEALAMAGARLSTEAILRIAGGILAALEQAARQLPGTEAAPYGHGLLTPENVFLAEGQRVLVRGFGMWPAAFRAGLVGPAQARHLAPAQLRSGAASPQSDLFSLATILFEIVCGVPAFDAAPDDEGIASLREAIEERQKQAEASLTPVYGAMLACLAPAPPVAAFRSRLRKGMDTLFLEEFPRPRPPKCLSLGELLDRVKPRRAVVVKARPLALERVTAAGPGKPAAEAAVAARDGAGLEQEQRPATAAAPLPPTASPRAVPRRPIAAVVSIGAAIVLAGAVALWSLRSRPAAKPAPAPRPAATAPAPQVGTPAPVRADPTPIPETPAPSRKRPPAVGGPSRRLQPTNDSVGTASTDVPSGSGAPSVPPPSVPAGSLVPVDTPGLVRPVVSEVPQPLRYGPPDSSLVVTRTALLEILVDERGRVRGSRILEVESPPAGFSSGLERYLAGLRFQPARVGEAPVRVWISYELKYLAP